MALFFVEVIQYYIELLCICKFFCTFAAAYVEQYFISRFR